jgi:O-antigen ligase
VSRAIPAELGLVAVLAIATLGEGGGSTLGLLGWHVALALVLVVAALAPDTTAPRRPGPAAPLLALAAFLLAVGTGVFRAPYFYAWLLAAIEIAAAVAIGALAARTGPELARRAAPALAAVGASQACFFLAQRFALGAERPAGTFLNPNHLAAWLAMALLVASVLRPRTTGGRIALALAVGTMLAALLLAASRGAWIGLAVGAAWRFRDEWHRVAPRARAIGAACGLMLILGAGWLVAKRMQNDPFPMHRLHIWRASLGQLAREPVWGTGLGQFPAAAAGLRFDDGRGPFRYDRSYSATHSDWIRMPVELGLPAAALFGAALVLGVVAIARRRREPGWPESADGAIAALVALGTQAMVDNPSRWPAAYVLAAALAGSLLSEPARVARRWPLAARAALVTACGIVWIAVDVRPTLAWLDAAPLPRGRLGPVEVARLDRAIERNRIHPDLWLRRAEHHAVDGTIDGYAVAREAAERAVALEPTDARYRWGLARVEGEACVGALSDRATCERAALAFEEAFARSPYDPRILLDAAELRLATGEPDEAAILARRALALEPHAAAGMLILAEAALEAGNDGVDAARDLVARAVETVRAQGESAAENRYSTELLTIDAARVERIGTLLRDPGRTGDAIGSSDTRSSSVDGEPARARLERAP